MIDREPNREAEPRMDQKVVIIMGSESDEEHCRRISGVLDDFGVNCEVRVASAHKTPKHLMSIIDELHEEVESRVVLIAVAGRSNALGGFLDFQTTYPVISCPPYSDKYGGVDIYSSLRMPSGSAAVTAIEPEMAALHAIKILAISNPELADKYQNFQRGLQEKIKEADKRFNSGRVEDHLSK